MRSFEQNKWACKMYPSNFTRDELIESDLARKYGFENKPVNESIENNLVYLANWLQRLRDKLGEHFGEETPVIISSGYRNPRLNRIAGGARGSFHSKGLAADIRVGRMSTAELTTFIIENFSDYDQVIEEYGRWVHVGLAVPRREALQKKSGKGYQPFIV